MQTNDFYRGLLFELHKTAASTTPGTTGVKADTGIGASNSPQATAPAPAPKISVPNFNALGQEHTTPAGTTYDAIPGHITSVDNRQSTSTMGNMANSFVHHPLDFISNGLHDTYNGIKSQVPEAERFAGKGLGMANQFSRNHPILTQGRGFGLGYGLDSAEEGQIQKGLDKMPTVENMLQSGSLPDNKNILSPFAQGTLQGDKGMLDKVNNGIGNKTEGFGEYNPQANKLDINFAKGFSTVGKQVATFLQSHWQALLASGGLMAILYTLMNHKSSDDQGNITNNYYGGAGPAGPAGPRFM